MDLATLLFWIFSAILVGASLVVVRNSNIVHSAMALILVFAMAAGVYMLLNAEFIAIVQILIYVGAVMILFLFALMLTRISGATRTNPSNKLWPVAAAICALLGGTILWAVLTGQHAVRDSATTAEVASQIPTGLNNVVRIGQLLYSPGSYSYVLPFEIASLVLLVAIVGAIVIGRED